MKKILIVLFIFFHILSYGQKKLIELKNEPVDIKLNGFYISSVIDGRENHDNIGFVRVGMFNKKVNADLSGGVEHSVLNYINNSLIVDTNLVPIVIKIVYLNISENTTFSSEIGRAEIKVEFYQLEDGKLGKLYETEAFLEEPGMDVTKGHEKRIRKILITCLKSFNNSDWRSNLPVYVEKEKILSEKENISETSFTKLNQEKVRWNSLLTFNKTFGINAEGWGFSYYGYTVKEKSNWIIPWVVSIESFTINTDYFSQFNYQKAKLNYWMPGLSAFKKLNDNLFVNLTFLIPIGSETLTDFNGHKTDNFLIGIAPTQGLYFIPKSNFGITFGIGIMKDF